MSNYRRYRNQVKHGYVKPVMDWKYSSFHRAVKWGIYPYNWCGEGANDKMDGKYLEYRFSEKYLQPNLRGFGNL